MKVRSSDRLLRRYLLLFLLLYAGLCLLLVGLRFGFVGLSAFGIAFVLLTYVAFRSGTPVVVQLGIALGILLGTLAGAGLGSLFGEAAGWVAGIAGGAILGAISAWIFLLVCLEGIFGLVPIHIGLHALPRAASLLSLAALLIGGAIGIAGFREAIPRGFGPTGSGALAGGMLGIAIGMLAGIKLDFDRQNQARSTGRRP